MTLLIALNVARVCADVPEVVPEPAPPVPATPAVVPNPFPTRVCFAPQENCERQMLRLLNSAKQSLDVAVYHINDVKIARKIAQKAKRIAVRVIADEGQARVDRSAIPELAKSGVNLRFGQQPGLFHHQFVVVDGIRVEMGSFNLTTHAFQRNQENQIYTSELPVIARYQKQFETMWATARPFKNLTAAPKLARAARAKSEAPAREVASRAAPAVIAPAPDLSPAAAEPVNDRPAAAPEPTVTPPAPSDW